LETKFVIFFTTVIPKNKLMTQFWYITKVLKKTHSNNRPENHEFFIGSFMRTTGSLTFWNNWDQWFFDLWFVIFFQKPRTRGQNNFFNKPCPSLVYTSGVHFDSWFTKFSTFCEWKTNIGHACKWQHGNRSKGKTVS
jgi:hypothetical protein